MNDTKKISKEEFLEFIKNNRCEMCLLSKKCYEEIIEDKKKSILKCFARLYNISFDSLNRLHDMARAIDNEKMLCEIEMRFEKLNEHFIKNSIDIKNILKSEKRASIRNK